MQTTADETTTSCPPTPKVRSASWTPVASVERFVALNGGVKLIKRILIANNGNAAIKAIRSIQQWAYDLFGNENEIEFVAMATSDDIEANAEYLAAADFVVDVPAGQNYHNYANVDLIVQIAEEFDCDAVWPGWGHASENPKLPEALQGSAVWIGPSHLSMLSLGDKIGSSLIAQAVGVRCVPWSGDSVTLDENGKITPEALAAACVPNVESAIEQSNRIGYPVMIKASEGGGGKGIRRCNGPGDVGDAYRQVTNEVKGSPVFAMKLIENCRHLEVQILADVHGTVISVGTRDCTIQRRHQKIIEEGPVTSAPISVVTQMESAAVRMCVAVGYVNAATVEFLFDPAKNEFHFLEVNARLQVEHVVTEITADINLPAAQLQIAMGIPLKNIKDVSSYLSAKESCTLQPRHVIAARITAEHAEENFRPTTGEVHELQLRSGRNAWGYFSIGAAGRIHTYSDSQFGHIFAFGPTRRDARNHMMGALRGLTVRGEIRTNVEALVKIMENEDFINHSTHTTWLERSISFDSPTSASENSEILLAVMLAALYESHCHFRASEALFCRNVNQGQIPPKIDVVHQAELVCFNTKFLVTCMHSGPDRYTLGLNKSRVVCVFRPIKGARLCESSDESTAGGYLVSGGLDGRSRRVFYKEDAAGIRVTFNGTTVSFSKESDPSQVRAPVSGKLVRWLAANESTVVKGQAYAEIEIMKMYMQLHIQDGGKILHALSEGAVFSNGDLLATLELPEGVVVQKAIEFCGEFSVPVDGRPLKPNPLRSFREARSALLDILDGYCVSDLEVDRLFFVFAESLTDPMLPYLEALEALSVLETRLSSNVVVELRSVLRRGADTKIPLPTCELLRIILGHFEGTQRSIVEPLHAVLRKYEDDDMAVAAAEAFRGLLLSFLEVEEIFYRHNESSSKVIQMSRTEFSTERLMVLSRSHQALGLRTRLILRVLERLRSQGDVLSLFAETLQRLSSLSRPEFAHLSANARSMVLTRKRLPFVDRVSSVHRRLRELVDSLVARSLTHPSIDWVKSFPHTPPFSTPITNPGGSSPVDILTSSLNDLIRDVDRASNDTLVAEITSADVDLGAKKLALDVFVRRHFDGVAARLQSFLVAGNGESIADDLSLSLNTAGLWASPIAGIKGPEEPEDKPMPAADSVLVKNSLVGVWMHTALFSQDFLNRNVHCITSSDRISSRSMPGVGSQTSLCSVGSTRNFEGPTVEKGVGTRLHHMLNAFAGHWGGPASQLGRSQKTVCLPFSNFQDFQNNLTECVQEFGCLSKYVPYGPPTPDGKILLLFVGIDDSSECFHSDPVSASKFEAELNRSAVALQSCGFHLIIVCYLCPKPDSSDSPSGQDEPSRLRWLYMRCPNLLSGSGAATDGEDADRSDESDRADIDALSSLSQTPASAPPTYSEETLLRNTDVSHLDLLELRRLSNFVVRLEPTSLPNVHLFEAMPRATSQSRSIPRYFVRVVSVIPPISVSDEVWVEVERVFVAALITLEAATRSRPELLSGNHLLFAVVITVPTSALLITPNVAEKASRKLAARYEMRLLATRVNVVEARFIQRIQTNPHDPIVPIRLVLENPTGQALRIRKFVEVTSPTSGEHVFSALDSMESLTHLPLRTPAPLTTDARQDAGEVGTRNERECEYDGKPVDMAHRLAGPLDQNRSLAASLSTVYIYDFLFLFEEAVRKMWQTCPKYFFPRLDGDSSGSSPRQATGRPPSQPQTPATTFVPTRVFEAVELTLNARGELEEVDREPGLNECGMVVWKVSMRTPEFPAGRRIILIGNDATHQMGTFGVQEDLLFQRASEMARRLGVPRVYIAVNSGARMGVATEVQKCLRVRWIDETNPTRGFKYLYLTEPDYRRLAAADAVVCELIQHPTEGRIYKLSDIIGTQIGLGVENLCGSGAIAGETSRAYSSCMTITLVTGRTVGIGAYITRLGQRVIQKMQNAPILLTGYQALNRLIGRELYSSNDEIGGIDVMHRNGVSHRIVKNDIEGCEAILQWLSYVPEHREGPLPIMVDPADPVTRPLLYRPSSSTEDPRLMLTGCYDSKGQWLGGIFDRGSFREVLVDWAKSVIVGRARLGGVPVGVIAVETRVTECKHPADPAMPQTSELTLLRPGQVWFPDSAYKTAQSINDFNNEELPLMILANWRGFSGGQRDMFNEVLKFGSFIVDALVAFKQPCFVYIPPKAELRGGAWVVVDPRINADFMEMYSDTECRGGVLEPTGTVEIKFREKTLTEMACRLDPLLKSYAAEDRRLASEGVGIDGDRRQQLKERRDRRIQDLIPIYKQVAVHFADLHDTPVRMKKRHAINDIVPWEKARQFFYWRLRRQLIVCNLRTEIFKANPSYTPAKAEKLISEWTDESGLPTPTNMQFVQWACSSISDISRRLQILRKKHIKQIVASYCQESMSSVLEAVRESDQGVALKLHTLIQFSEVT